MSLVYEDQEEAMVEMDRELICHTLQGKPIKPKTLGQKRYVDAIREGMITFGLGPAGTGKTYLAMAMAITAFQRNEVSRIILTRPAIEAGENWDFFREIFRARSIPICVLFMMHCIRSWERKVLQKFRKRSDRGCTSCLYERKNTGQCVYHSG